MKLSKVVGVKKSGHKIKAPLALLGLVLSIVVIPMNAAHAEPWITTGYSGSGSRFMAVDHAGNLYVANLSSNSVTKITPTGVATQCGETGLSPRGIAIDSSGNIYTSNSGDDTVSKITPSCDFQKVFGHTGSRPWNIAIDQAGNIYTANYGSDNISKITPDGFSTIDYVSTGIHSAPTFIITDQAGNLYVTDCGPHDIENFSPIDDVRKITADRVVTILGTTGQCPGSLFFDSSGNIYTSNQASSFISKISPAGDSIQNFAPAGGSLPYGLAIDPLGNIYVTNYQSKNIFKVTPDGHSALLGTTGASGPTGIIYSSGNVYAVNIDGTVSKFTLTTTSSGSAPNSQVAAISRGDTGVVIPSTTALPATSLKFGGSVPESVTVVPVASNPATVSATPFTISGSTKIVDIQISGTFNGSATVCLDGLPTDHLYHYTGGKWEELPSRTYALGQVCGVTTSFSPFAAAPPVPAALVAAPVPVPDPVQQSKITALSVSTAIAGTPTPVEITGSFVEKIKAIQINGVALAAGSWTQSATSVAFTMPGKSAGTYQIQLFNGSAPVLKVQNFTFTAPIVVVAPTPTPTAKPKVTYIRCAKPGHGTRVAYGVNPTCPAGYVKK